jgi:hypothetical protein
MALRMLHCRLALASQVLQSGSVNSGKEILRGGSCQN